MRQLLRAFNVPVLAGKPRKTLARAVRTRYPTIDSATIEIRTVACHDT